MPLISLKSFHTFHLKAKAQSHTVISHVDELSALSGKVKDKDFLVLGQGSNCAFLQDYSGEIVTLNLLGKEVSESTTHFTIQVSASESWHEFVVWCLENGIHGLENLALIPGTVGAAPIQNIGAYGVEVERFIESVTYFDLEDGTLKAIGNSDCEFAYRDSIFKGALKPRAIITQVDFIIPKAWQAVCEYGELARLESPSAWDIFKRVCEIRRCKLPDPEVLGNAGSFFKNPIVSCEKADQLRDQYPHMPQYELTNHEVKLAAGWLIDTAGLKGVEVDGVAVHDKQALVMVNKSGDANGEALLHLIALVRTKVREQFGIILEPEVRLIGRQGEITDIVSLLERDNG